MTRQEVFRAVETFDIKDFYVKRVGEDDYELLFGEDDPYEIIRKQQMEINTLQRQFRYAMAAAYGVPFDKAEELII